MASDVPEPLNTKNAAKRLDISQGALRRRAELARDEVFGAIEAGLTTPRTEPDPSPPESILTRAAKLAGMFMMDEPCLGRVHATWQERGNQLVSLGERLDQVIHSTPDSEPQLFMELRMALVQAKFHVDRERAWRNNMTSEARAGRAVTAMPFSLRALWADDPHQLGRRQRGPRRMKGAIAETARQYGLTHRHMALLESALRIDIEPWSLAVLPWGKKQELYLEPLPGERDDQVTSHKILERWRKVFESLDKAVEE